MVKLREFAKMREVAVVRVVMVMTVVRVRNFGTLELVLVFWFPALFETHLGWLAWLN